MKQRVQVHLCRLVLSALFLDGCAESSEQQETEIDLHELNEIVPQQFPIVGDKIWRFEVNGDGANEWMVLYHVDLILQNVGGALAPPYHDYSGNGCGE